MNKLLNIILSFCPCEIISETPSLKDFRVSLGSPVIKSVILKILFLLSLFFTSRNSSRLKLYLFIALRVSLLVDCRAKEALIPLLDSENILKIS